MCSKVLLAHNIALIILFAPQLQPELKDVVQSLQKNWGTIWDEQIQPFIEKLSKDEKPIDRVKKLIGGMPLSDIGSKRVIAFNALTIDWHVEFENNEKMTAIGEEFVSFLQATLCEIATEEQKILLLDQKVEILFQDGHFQKEYLGDGKWVLTIPAFNSNEQDEVRVHYLYLGSLITSIFSKMTNLTKDEMSNFYLHLLKEKKLGEKVLEGTAYQRAYKQSLDTSSLDIIRGSDFKALANESRIAIQRKWLV